MPMVGNNRGDVDYNAIKAANPNWGKFSPSEDAMVKHFFEVLFSADTTYIQGNADVSPAAHTGENLSAPTGQPVTIPVTNNPGMTSVGTVTADTECNGLGSIL